MKIKKITKSLLLILVAIGIITACSSDDTCRESKVVEMGMTLYVDSINPATGLWVEQKITVEPLTIHGVGVDSLLTDSESVSSVKAPLNQFAETSAFRFDFGSFSDTITIHHKNSIELLSLECGSVRTYNIESASTSGHFIDSITILNPSVTNFHVENIKLHHIK